MVSGGNGNARKVIHTYMHTHTYINVIFNEKSRIDLVEGIAESDPIYCDEVYCNYSIDEYPVL